MEINIIYHSLLLFVKLSPFIIKIFFAQLHLVFTLFPLFFRGGGELHRFHL